MSNENTPYPSQAEDELWGLRKPQWDTWKSVKQIRLWQAIALACDLDPSNFQLFDTPQLSRMMKHPTKQFEDLLDMAKGAIGAGRILKLHSKSNEGLEESEVRLSNFASWLNTVPHQIPAEFPWSPEPITFNNLDWPWGRHETDLLRKLAAAADRFWKNYDPNDPSTAPTNQQVIDWLKEQGVATRTAEVIASILRADGLSTGPRKN